jgi:hypothetical protein
MKTGYIIRKNIFLFFLPIFLASYSSCTFLRPSKNHQQTKIEWDKKTPQEVLDELRKSQKLIRDLTAHFSLSLDPPPEGHFSNLQGILIFAKGEGGNMIRIKALAPFGRLMFDLVQKDNHIEIFIPSMNTLYRGDIRAGNQAGNPWGEAFKGMFEDFSGMEVDNDAGFIFSDGIVILPLIDGTLKFNIRNGFLTELSRNGRTIIYDQYQQKKDLSPIPTSIRMISGNGSKRAECHFSQLCVNCDPGDVFHLDGYKPRFIKSLDEIEQ